MTDAARVKMTVKEYRELVPEDHNGIVELINGEIVTTVAKQLHQRAIGKVYRALSDHLGDERVSLAPVNVYFDDENYLEPDVFYVGGDDARCHLGADGFWYGAPALIVEVLSASTARRDRIDKFLLYEKYRVQEYWLVEPDTLTLEVYTLEGDQYRRHGVYQPGDTLISPLLNAPFTMDNLLGS